jgi:hypothetical protein
MAWLDSAGCLRVALAPDMLGATASGPRLGPTAMLNVAATRHAHACARPATYARLERVKYSAVAGADGGGTWLRPCAAVSIGAHEQAKQTKKQPRHSGRTHGLHVHRVGLWQELRKLAQQIRVVAEQCRHLLIYLYATSIPSDTHASTAAATARPTRWWWLVVPH